MCAWTTLALATGCDNGGGGDDSGGTSTSGDPPPATTTSDDTTGTVEPGSTTDVEPGTSSSSGGSSSTGEDPTDSDSDTDDGGNNFDCDGGRVITAYEMEFSINTIEGVAIPTEPKGYICMLPNDAGLLADIRFGSKSAGEWESIIRVRLEGVGEFDMSADFGTPGLGEEPANGIGYSWTEPGSASTVSFDTANQEGKGLLTLTSIPTQPGETLELTADGAIAGKEGWQFGFTLNATLEADDAGR